MTTWACSGSFLRKQTFQQRSLLNRDFRASRRGHLTLQEDTVMNIRHTFIPTVTAATCLFVYLILLSTPAQAQVQAWKPIDPEHVALKAPVVEKDADAEAIFWEVYFKDELDGSTLRKVFSNYVRIKIFSQRGVENHSTVDL